MRKPNASFSTQVVHIIPSCTYNPKFSIFPSLAPDSVLTLKYSIWKGRDSTVIFNLNVVVAILQGEGVVNLFTILCLRINIPIPRQFVLLCIVFPSFYSSPILSLSVCFCTTYMWLLLLGILILQIHYQNFLYNKHTTCVQYFK